MKQDLTSKIIKAGNYNKMWALHEFYSVKEFIDKRGYTFSFWDGEEYWAFIKENETTIGYLWKKYPLLIYLNAKKQKAEDIINSFSFLETIAANNFNSKDFSLNYESVKNYINFFPSMDSFSIHDLWFNTNSI